MISAIVIGGGLGGLSAAIGLALNGHQVTLLEAQPEFSELGAGIQLPSNATRILKGWGLLEEVCSRAPCPKLMTCRSYRDGSVLHNFQLDPYTQDGFGSPHLIVHRKELLYILVAKARSLNVCLRTDCQTTGIDMKTRSVTTARGDTFTADLILGADGGRSFCRSFILGRPDLPKATGKLVYRFTISSEAVWRDPDFRDLVDPTAITCWIGPKSHVVAYELPHSGIYNVSLTCPDPIEGRAQFGPRDADMDELNQMFSEWDPVYVKLLRAADRAQYWTLLQLPEENRTWIDSETQRMLLIGDAAHSMTMYLAQGASQSIEDGAFLGHIFERDTSPDDIPGLLRFFCERRQPRTLAIRARAKKAGDVLEMEDGPAQEMRDRRMREGKLCEGFPNHFADPTLQQWLYKYDVAADARRT